jgi:hypothetical protein
MQPDKSPHYRDGIQNSYLVLEVMDRILSLLPYVVY